MARKALITGITGQDGSYLAELLPDKGYEVHGLLRRASHPNLPRLAHLVNDPNLFGHCLFLHWGDPDDPTPLRRVLLAVAPDEMYHLAGQSEGTYHQFRPTGGGNDPSRTGRPCQRGLQIAGARIPRHSPATGVDSIAGLLYLRLTINPAINPRLKATLIHG